MSFLDELFSHAREVYGTLSHNERIRERSRGYADSVKQGLLSNFPVLAKSPLEVNTSDILGSGFGAMPMSIKAKQLYHGGNDYLDKIVKNKYTFDGVFASPSESAALGHGDKITKIYVDEKKIMDSGDGSLGGVYGEVINRIKKRFPDATDDEIEGLLYPSIAEDKGGLLYNYDPETLKRLTGYDDPGEVSWLMQNERGLLAKDLGYDAVKMDDEHGTSYFIPYGSRAKIRK